MAKRKFTLGKVGKAFSWIWGKIKWAYDNPEKVNAVGTIFLFIVSCALVWTTAESISATKASTEVAKELGDIETLLSLQRQKAEVSERITLALNLILEAEINKISVYATKSNIEGCFNIDGTLKEKCVGTAFQDDISINRIEQAQEHVLFGSETLKVSMNVHMVHLRNLKMDLAEIIDSTKFGIDREIKIQRMLDFISISKNLLEGGEEYVDFDMLINEAIAYKQEQESLLDEIDQKLEAF